MLEDKQVFRKSAAHRASGPPPAILAAAQQNPASAQVWREDCTLHWSPGSTRAIHLDSKLFNIQSKDKRSSWTCKRDRTLFSDEFRELCIEMGKEESIFWLAQAGILGLLQMVPGLLQCAEHTHSSSTGPLMLPREPCEHLGVCVSQKGRKHTKAGAGR